MFNKYSGKAALILTLLTLIISGCISLKDKDQSAKDAKNESSEHLKPIVILANLPEKDKIELAEPIISGIVEGMNKEDYDLYTKDFPQSFKEKFTDKEFKTMNEKSKQEIGQYKEKKVMGVLHKKLFDIFFYKAKFSKFDDDILMRLFLVEEEGKYKVYMFNISPF